MPKKRDYLNFANGRCKGLGTLSMDSIDNPCSDFPWSELSTMQFIGNGRRSQAMVTLELMFGSFLVLENLRIIMTDIDEPITLSDRLMTRVWMAAAYFPILFVIYRMAAWSELYCKAVHRTKPDFAYHPHQFALSFFINTPKMMPISVKERLIQDAENARFPYFHLGFMSAVFLQILANTIDLPVMYAAVGFLGLAVFLKGLIPTLGNMIIGRRELPSFFGERCRNSSLCPQRSQLFMDDSQDSSINSEDRDSNDNSEDDDKEKDSKDNYGATRVANFTAR